jgi:ABC-2 type transport system ATP-binding protein
MNPVIAISDLVMRYGAVTAVDHVDLTIHRGQTVALLGPNGAGKTTTVKNLLGVLRPSAGEVRIFGATPRDAVRAGHIAAMQQDGGLMQGVTVRELISFVRGLYREPLSPPEIVEAAGLDDILDKRADRLSGGQTQRVRFAVALAGDPDILVLDEPTAAMDVESRRAFWVRMREFAGAGRTVLFATHYLEEADAVADRVIVMARGKIVSDGSVTQLKSGVSARLVRFTGVSDGLADLAGVVSVEQHGATVVLRSSDAEATVRALFATRERVPDLEVSGASLEDAFLAITKEPA